MSAPQQGETYFRVNVRNLPRSREDEFSAFCFERGATGVSERLSFVQPDVTFDPSVVETSSFEADVFFEARPPEDFLLRLAGEFSEAEASAMEEPNKDWLEEWKKGFVPFPFVGPFWIVPSWFERPKQAEEAIWMEPGMAFGTGTHETTRLAATLLVDALRERAEKADSRSGVRAPSVLDVGTGTGVLAIVARRLGARRTVAIDNDLEARRVARENLEANSLAAEIEVPDQNLEDVEGAFDLVVANIIDGALVHIQPGLSRVLAPGGAMILSGILLEREKAFLERFLPPARLRISRRLEMGEWAAFELRA